MSDLREWALRVCGGNVLSARAAYRFVDEAVTNHQVDQRISIVNIDPYQVHNWQAALSFLEGRDA